MGRDGSVRCDITRVEHPLYRQVQHAFSMPQEGQKAGVGFQVDSDCIGRNMLNSKSLSLYLGKDNSRLPAATLCPRYHRASANYHIGTVCIGSHIPIR